MAIMMMALILAMSHTGGGTTCLRHSMEIFAAVELMQMRTWALGLWIGGVDSVRTWALGYMDEIFAAVELMQMRTWALGYMDVPSYRRGNRRVYGHSMEIFAAVELMQMRTWALG
ncbi:hypothetical protein C8F01DRAFT_1269433 [Mycena amicta]|nr:hypothetical protein C8F01DRAFT_1269433 [Mycena amicta]